MRVPHRLASLVALIVFTLMALVTLSNHAYAQLVEITPLPTDSPSSELAPGTQWVFWMAIGAGVIALLMLLGFASGYLRFAPKFFGREEKATPPPPGVRPPALARQAAQVRYTPPPAAERTGATAPAQAQTATAVAERPSAATAAPAAAATAAPAEAAPAEAAPAEAATEEVTAPPSGEPAAQADAVGQAETEAPEERPTAKTEEEVGAEPDEAPAAAPQPAAPQPAAPQPAAPQPAAPQPAQASASGSADMDQKTFDRVLKEQLERGVDRRVAEGRARAAAVVAARKKAQG